MFLKTQEDIDELLREYPLESHEIRISRGEENGSNNYIYIGSENAYTIENTHESITLHVDCSLPNMVPGEDNIDFRDTYTYANEGIKIHSLFRKLSHKENTLGAYPLIANGIDLINEKDAVMELYIKIEKFIQHYNRIKRQYFIICNTNLDIEHAKENWDYDYKDFGDYFTESQASHFGIFYRRLLDGDSRYGNRTTIKTIIEDAKSLGIIDDGLVLNLEITDIIGGEREETKTIKEWLDRFGSFNGAINNYICHNDENTFEQRIEITRTSDTGRSIVESILSPDGIFSKLDELIQFIDKVFSQYFSKDTQLSGNGENYYKIQLIKTN